MSTFVFSPKHKGALDRPLVVALVDTGTHARGSQTKLSNIDAVASNASQRPDRFSCPLQEPSLHFGRQRFENWRLFFGLGLFLSGSFPLKDPGTLSSCNKYTVKSACTN